MPEPFPLIDPLASVNALVVCPKFCRSNVPPEMVIAGLRSASPTPSRRMPPVTLVPPVKKFTTASSIVPDPVLLSVPMPLIGIVTVKVCPASTWNVLAGSPRFTARVRVNPVAICSVPAFKVRPPATLPRFALLLTITVPPLMVVPPM
jgi:hypothetical protein